MMLHLACKISSFESILEDGVESADADAYSWAFVRVLIARLFGVVSFGHEFVND